MHLEDAINNATTAVRMRQTPSGRWEFYGPRAGYQNKQQSATKGGLMARQGLVTLELLGLEPQSRHWYAAKNEMSRRFHRAGKPKDLKELVVDTLAFLEAQGLSLVNEVCT